MYLKPEKIREETKVLFVNLDDIFVLQHKKKKTPIRSAIAFTGIKTKYGRNSLHERVLIPIDPNLGVTEQVFKLEETLSYVYGKINKIIIIGDGAN
jgi:hypothetical protein